MVMRKHATAPKTKIRTQNSSMISSQLAKYGTVKKYPYWAGLSSTYFSYRNNVLV